MFTLHTTSYRHFNPRMGTAIRTSIGHPRWRLPYALDIKLTELMPSRAMLNLPYGEYEDRYLRQLEEVGVEHLEQRFQAIAVAVADTRLVLLCFESLAEPGDWCHRRMFADWWEVQTGEPVRERRGAR
ncbi:MULTISPECIES: hypothetical protein [unclassified Nocardioides]|uniref:hypothetical protein n=1 Tax=unclassified Nocardioides TaxID=2615069 RepID=UPI00070288FB|nr:MULTISPECIES: hypothetical protein [unclassified Nocardioides]KRC53946.1 hypothetical protein ASE19_07650 [Nocardioides sp. Root79]KRC71282.1 hypothetical protein ASE20_10065 [Nocardioides sp. Root240]